MAKSTDDSGPDDPGELALARVDEGVWAYAVGAAPHLEIPGC